jgi:hypothetical protein
MTEIPLPERRDLYFTSGTDRCDWPPRRRRTTSRVFSVARRFASRLPPVLGKSG